MLLTAFETGSFRICNQFYILQSHNK